MYIIVNRFISLMVLVFLFLFFYTFVRRIWSYLHVDLRHRNLKYYYYYYYYYYYLFTVVFYNNYHTSTVILLLANFIFNDNTLFT